MKTFRNKCISKVTSQLLTWLGIGSASMLFVACYGTPPENYRAIDDEDTVTVMVGDSVVMTVTRDDATADMAATEEAADTDVAATEE